VSAHKDPAEVYTEFRAVVNMSPATLEKWLASDNSQSVGWTGGSDGERKSSTGGQESKGHESGREIVQLLRTKKADLSEDDYAQMQRVVGYVHRHLAQRPTKEDVETSRWRYSLMNWGHDPLQD